MTGFLEGIANFFARHRAHCSVHEAYRSDCADCIAANQRIYVDSGADFPVPADSFASGDSYTVTDSSSTTDCTIDTADFSGFGGGDSGGGGASGDF